MKSMHQICSTVCRVMPSALLSLSTILGLLTVGAENLAAQSLPCGTVITANTTLKKNVGPCTAGQFGIIFGASNITLDLNGNSIIGLPGSFTGVTSAGHINNEIKGYHPTSISHVGTITGFNIGIDLDGDISDIVEHVHITSNGEGIATEDGSGGNTFAYNTISGNGFGMLMNNAPADRIIGNTIAGNALGMEIDSPGPTVMTGNAVVNNNDDGLRLLADTQGMLITNNEFSCNKGNGINYVGGNGGMTINSNRISANMGDGVSLNSESGIRTELNTVSDNGGNGIALRLSDTNCTNGNITIGNGTDDLFWDGANAGTNFWPANHFDTANMSLPTSSC